MRNFFLLTKSKPRQETIKTQELAAISCGTLPPTRNLKLCVTNILLKIVIAPSSIKTTTTATTTTTTQNWSVDVEYTKRIIKCNKISFDLIFNFFFFAQITDALLWRDVVVVVAVVVKATTNQNLTLL